MRYALNYSGTRFLSTEITITQFLNGFRLNLKSYYLTLHHPLPIRSGLFPLRTFVPQIFPHLDFFQTSAAVR